MVNPDFCSSIPKPNPCCKICLDTVTPKSGVQCKGECKTWIHYKCLNYTPGKISDIKAGYIQINCPCPDCITTDQKEFVTQKNSSGQGTCAKNSCPANTPPKYEKKDCVENRNSPTLEKTLCDKKECAKSVKPNTPECRRSPISPTLSPPTLSPPTYNSPTCNPPTFNPPTFCPPTSTPPNYYPHTCCPPNLNPPGCRPTCNNDSIPPHPTCHNQIQPQPINSDDSMRAHQLCKGGCMASSGDDRAKNINETKECNPPANIEEMCDTVGKLTLQINGLMGEMKSALQSGQLDGKGNRRVGFKTTGCSKGNCKTRKPPPAQPCPSPCCCEDGKNKMMKTICDFRKKWTNKLMR